MAKGYVLSGRELLAEPYHYTQCGLDDIYLLNGVIRRVTPYGEGAAVENADELHEAIALSLCTGKAFLTGKEFRFLRKLMELSQAELARLFGCNVQAVARWEKGLTSIPGAADRLMRVFYAATIKLEMSATDLIEQVSELDDTPAERQVFEETDHGWKAAA
jgi:DNA-binding transcriptional regulator YiaG